MQNPTAVSFVMKTFFQIPVEEPQILPDSAASANHQTAPNDNVPSKASGKKQKREADKGYIHDLPLFRFFFGNNEINIEFKWMTPTFTWVPHRGKAEGAAVWSVQPEPVRS